MPAHIDELIQIDGVVIATGWAFDCDIVFKVGESVIEPACVIRSHRQDLVATQHKRPADNQDGIKVVLAMPNGTDPSQISISTGDGRQVTAGSDVGEQYIGKALDLFKQQVNKTGGKMIEIGSRKASIKSHREMFPTLIGYVAVSRKEAEEPDIVADPHELSSKVKEQFDFAFSISEFQHLLMPWIAALELNKVLKRGGYCYIQSHTAWPLYDNTNDFMRFSKEGWHAFFNHYSGFEVISTGYDVPGMVIPRVAGNPAFRNIDREPTYLLSGCLARKVSDPKVNWTAKPHTILGK